MPAYPTCTACQQGLGWDGFTPHVQGCPERVEPTITTEDGAKLAEGDRAYNYYDMKPGTIRRGRTTADPDPWFDFDHDDGTRALLNGVRICSLEGARRRGFPGA